MCLGIVFQAGGVVYVSATPKQPALDTKIHTPSFRDQSIANLLALAKRLIDHKDTASIADAVKKYTAVFSAARQSANPAALDRLKLSAYMLTNALRAWEAAR